MFENQSISIGFSIMCNSCMSIVPFIRSKSPKFWLILTQTYRRGISLQNWRYNFYLNDSKKTWNSFTFSSITSSFIFSKCANAWLKASWHLWSESSSLRFFSEAHWKFSWYLAWPFTPNEMIILRYYEVFFRLSAPRCAGTAAGAVSLKKPYDIIILSFR